jgi:hypothetical protein
LEILINHFISYHIIHQENPNRLSSSSFHIDSVDANIVYLLCNMFSCNNIFVSGFLAVCLPWTWGTRSLRRKRSKNTWWYKEWNC